MKTQLTAKQIFPFAFNHALGVLCVCGFSVLAISPLLQPDFSNNLTFLQLDFSYRNSEF